MKLKNLFSMAVVRMVLVVIAVMVPVNLVTLFLSRTAVNEVEKQYVLETENALELYISQIDDAMERAVRKIRTLAMNDVDFARINVKDIRNKTEYYNQIQASVRMRIGLKNALNDNMLVTGMYVFFPEKDMRIFESNYTAYQSMILEHLKRIIKKEEILKSGQWKTMQLEGHSVALFLSRYKNAYYGVWFDLDSLLARLQSEEGNAPVWAFVTKSGEICCARNSEGLELKEILEGHESHGYMVIQSYSRFAGISLVQVMTESQVTNHFSIIIRFISMAVIVTLLAIPVIIYALHCCMIVPLNQLTFAMKRIESGDMEFRITEPGIGSEFNQINKNFNHMLDEVSALKINVYEERLEKQNIKMRFLSQQIQPHFIQNAMNILYSYEQEEYPLIQKMILCLAKYFRYVVNANTDFVELKEEMNHIKNYFEIQHARYPEEFFTIVEWDKEIEECPIPPLLIQNFAENAIKHSLAIGNCIDIIVIAKKLGTKKVQIIISDSGRGISEELLEKIRVFRESRIYQEGLGVGIQNAIERLDILYEGRAELNIGRDSPNGTRVEIILDMMNETASKEIRRE